MLEIEFTYSHRFKAKSILKTHVLFVQLDKNEELEKVDLYHADLERFRSLNPSKLSNKLREIIDDKLRSEEPEFYFNEDAADDLRRGINY